MFHGYLLILLIFNHLNVITSNKDVTDFGGRYLNLYM